MVDDRCPHCGAAVERRVTKMATKRRNWVDVGSLIQKYGRDAARVGVLSLGPHERDLTWSESGVEGARRWLERTWKLIEQCVHAESGPASEPPTALLDARDRCVRQVTRDLGELRTHLAVSRLIALVNQLQQSARTDGGRPERLTPRGLRTILRDVVIMMAPLAPESAECMWRRLGYPGSAFQATWPQLQAAAR